MKSQSLNLSRQHSNKNMLSDARWREFGNHTVRVENNHDESASQDFYLEMYRFLGKELGPARKKVYESKVKKEFRAKNGYNPKNRHQVRKAVKNNPFFQYWGHMRSNINQEMFYKNQLIVERQIEELNQKAKVGGRKIGKLTLDSNLEIPRYQSLDMHWMPGSYYSEKSGGNDISAGALYDSGGIYLMTNGALGPFNDGAAYSLINFFRTKHPCFNPSNILDLGCTVGHNTLPFKEFWPGSKVTGIDIGAPVLRYAHARSAHMGYSIDYSQQNAEKTNFGHSNFDLIVSTMFLHETSKKAIKNIFNECYRLLKPGGLMVHVEQPPFNYFKDPYEQFIRDWDTHNNNEPFWGPMHDLDLNQMACHSGFEKKDIFEEMIPLVKPNNKNKFSPGVGEWYVFGGWKK